MKDIRNQVIFIRGGEAFDNKEEFYTYLKQKKYDPYKKQRAWRDWLEWSLSETFDLFAPIMPNKQFADYKAWSIWFEKIFPYINMDPKVKLIVIGQSLGVTFLAKYLSENEFPKKIDQLHFVCPVFDNEGLVGEKVGSFALDVSKLGNIESKTKNFFMYHSTDDPVSPYTHSEKYLKYLKNVEFFKFEGRGHFAQPAFPEILQVINEHL